MRYLNMAVHNFRVSAFSGDGDMDTSPRLDILSHTLPTASHTWKGEHYWSPGPDNEGEGGLGGEGVSEVHERP